MDKDINQALFKALSACFREASIPIRQAFTNPVPPPPGNDQDILYYHLLPDESAPWLETSHGLNGFPAFFRFAAYLLMLTVYGPYAEDLAWKIYHRLYLDGYDLPRQLLRDRGIYPLPHPSPPSLCWEEWEKEHRLRADLVIPLRIIHSEIDQALIPGMALHPPEIKIHTENETSS